MEKELKPARRVLVVGFGLSGIVATHYFTSSPDIEFDVTVVEKDGALGGVWELDNHYPGIKLNNSKHTFEFPDLRGDEEERDDFPTQEQVNKYLHDYVQKFDLERYVQYNTSVEHVSRHRIEDGDSHIWEVEFSQALNNKTPKSVTTPNTYEFDFVCVCTGIFQSPSIPQGFTCSDPSLGLPQDQCLVLHSSNVRRVMKQIPDLFEGKRIAVVGASKSAQDIAYYAATSGKASTVNMCVGEGLHWTIPQYFGSQDPSKGVYNENILFSRFSGFLSPCSPTGDTSVRDGASIPYLSKLLHESKIGIWIRNWIWGQVSKVIRWNLNIPKEVKLRSSFVQDIAKVSVSFPEFFSTVKRGDIKLVYGRAKQTSTTKSKVLEVDLGAECNHMDLECDVVILATGFDSYQGLSFLDDEILSKLFLPTKHLSLFHGCYNPDIPQLAFVGYQESVNNMFSAAILAKWVVELAKGEKGSLGQRGVLKNTEKMKLAIKASQDFEIQQLVCEPSGVKIGAGIPALADSVMDELGGKLYRLPHGWFGELNYPFLPKYFAGLAFEKYLEPNSGKS